MLLFNSTGNILINTKNSNTTFVTFQHCTPIGCSGFKRIQIQHLLLFNKLELWYIHRHDCIQIQHLLMFNCSGLVQDHGTALIQIQLLLLFNGHIRNRKTGHVHSNTTLVNVQLHAPGKIHFFNVIQIQHLLLFNNGFQLWEH